MKPWEAQNFGPAKIKPMFAKAGGRKNLIQRIFGGNNAAGLIEDTVGGLVNPPR
jgi:hypothetical protein